MKVKHFEFPKIRIPAIKIPKFVFPEIDSVVERWSLAFEKLHKQAQAYIKHSQSTFKELDERLREFIEVLEREEERLKIQYPIGYERYQKYMQLRSKIRASKSYKDLVGHAESAHGNQDYLHDVFEKIYSETKEDDLITGMRKAVKNLQYLPRNMWIARGRKYGKIKLVFDDTDTLLEKTQKSKISNHKRGIVYTANEDIEEIIKFAETSELISTIQCSDTLTPSEKEIIEIRYLRSNEVVPFEEISNIVNKSKQTLEETEKRAIKKLTEKLCPPKKYF